MVEKVQGEVVSVQGKPVKPVANLDPVSVVQQAAVVKKQSGIRKFWRGFFAEDFRTAGGNVMNDVVMPSIKSGIANALTGLIYGALFGRNGAYNALGSPYRPFTNYQSPINYNKVYNVANGVVTNYKQPQGPSVTPGDTINVGMYKSTDIYDPYALQYLTWQDANDVYLELCRRISQYGVATVSNLYTASKQSVYDSVMVKWGWYDIPTHQIIPTGTYWVLKLPQPVPIA